VVSYTVVSAVQGISLETGSDSVGVVAGAFSPYTLVDGVLVWAFDTTSNTIIAPQSTVAGLGYVTVAVLTVLGAVALLVVRYRRLSSG